MASNIKGMAGQRVTAIIDKSSSNFDTFEIIDESGIKAGAIAKTDCVITACNTKVAVKFDMPHILNGVGVYSYDVKSGNTVLESGTIELLYGQILTETEYNNVKSDTKNFDKSKLYFISNDHGITFDDIYIGEQKMGFLNSDKINQALSTKANVSNTYTKNEVDTKIAALPQYTRTVVDELPESGNINTLYLLKVEHTEEYDYCDEYIWLTEKVGESNWEKIGNTKINLDDYYTKSEIDDFLENKQETLISGTNIKTINGESLLGSGDIEITSEGGYTKEEVDNLLNTKANKETTYTKDETNEKLSEKIDSSEVYTRTNVDEMLGAKQSTLNSGVNIKTINGKTILGSGDMKVGTLTARLMTQAEYDALQNKDNNTLYIITDAL